MLITDPSHPEEEDPHSELEIWAPVASHCNLKLVAPKLIPPGYLDILMQSQGNAEIKVSEVTRAFDAGEVRA